MARIPHAPAWASRARLESIGTVIVVAVAFRYWLLYFNRATNLLDEGSQASQALRILNGDLIYRDFFTVVTPGSYYTVAWLFQLFGAEMMVMRWTVLVLGLAILWLTMTSARHVITWPFAASAGLMTTVWGWFLVTPNFYSWQGAFLSLIALACYLRFAATARTSWMVFAGVATGLTVLVKQNVGVYTAAGLMLTTWGSMLFDAQPNVRGRIRGSVRFVTGMAVTIVPVLLYLIAAGAGPYMYESLVYYPFAKYPGRFALPYPPLYPVTPDLTTLREAIPALLGGRIPEPMVYEVWTKLVIYLPVIVYPFAAVALGVLAFRFRRHKDEEAGRHGHALLAISLVGILTILQAWPRADVTHILFGLQPTFILSAYLLCCVWKGLTMVPGPRVVVGAVALLITLTPQAWFLWNGYERTHWEYQNYIAALKVDRGRGVFASGIEAERINKMTSFIITNTTPGEPVFVVPWASGFNFLTDRPNPTRNDFMLFEDPEAYPCILSRLEQHPPKYVIYGYVWDVDGKHFSDYARPIDEYIRSRYTLEDSVDGYEAWKRIERANPATPPWPQACQPRRFRISDLVGRRP
jgi:hypothetical protein